MVTHNTCNTCKKLTQTMNASQLHIAKALMLSFNWKFNCTYVYVLILRICTINDVIIIFCRFEKQMSHVLRDAMQLLLTQYLQWHSYETSVHKTYHNDKPHCRRHTEPLNLCPIVCLAICCHYTHPINTEIHR